MHTTVDGPLPLIQLQRLDQRDKNHSDFTIRKKKDLCICATQISIPLTQQLFLPASV